MEKIKLVFGSLVLTTMVSCTHSYGQFSMSAQLRTRTELRDGQGAPLAEGAKPALFTSQRTRLNIGYNMFRLKFGVALQDVRVWGQDASSIHRTTAADHNSLMLHEGWAEILLSDTATKNRAISLKIGRQELVYDDQRLLGNLDWLQQGRRHDAALLKLETKEWTLHAAAAFNQNREHASGTTYNSTPPGTYPANTNGGSHYKSMQYLYAGKKLKSGTASFLAFTDQFNKYSVDPRTNTKTFESGVWSRVTTGFYVNNTWNRLGATASAYYQGGKSQAGQNLSAALLSGIVHYSISRRLNTSAGVDYTTGGSKGNTSRVFDPLYGTPHKFWGLMDYFYVASPFGSGGLTNYFVKGKYKVSDRFLLSLDAHQFSSAAKVSASTAKKNFGQEVDILGNYTITKQIGIEAGYGHFFATSLLTSPAVKNVPGAKGNANWAYVMINIKPEFLFK